MDFLRCFLGAFVVLSCGAFMVLSWWCLHLDGASMALPWALMGLSWRFHGTFVGCHGAHGAFMEVYELHAHVNVLSCGGVCAFRYAFIWWCMRVHGAFRVLSWCVHGLSCRLHGVSIVFLGWLPELPRCCHWLSMGCTVLSS